MIIFPAVDIKNGKCVRLIQGRAQDETIYGDPVAMAQKWQAAGARYLHVVDLDGAFCGKGENIQTIRAMIGALYIPMQLGGGIRTVDDIAQRLEMGVDRVILGTVAVEDPELVAKAAAMYPGRIAVGIDAKHGKVAIRGWVEDSGMDAVDLAKGIQDAGVDTVIYTDISRDGMLGGPNYEATQAIVETGLRVIGSGGVGKGEHLRILSDIGCYGAIVGKALYDGRMDISEALAFQKDGDS
ncbi:MAG: 1-(5-phosphoribosyl)-5-[(5-phosphoribosylamino)methylideneamino]imidazole-4-carboxamide isomerase [Christensenellales bacterium]|jgi:phosphoribosylformimino-5-aminoimidazole carboxamide ribotide isomerase